MVARLYIYSHMKTLLLTAAFFAAGISAANGQTSEVYRGINFIPSSCTYNGKPVIAGITPDYQTAKILDTNLNVVKQFPLKTERYVDRSYYEIATVMPTGAEFDEYDDSYVLREEQQGTPMTATDLTTMQTKLATNYNCPVDALIGFTDIKGNISCYWHNIECFSEGLFGKKYPTEYFTIINGEVNRVFVYDWNYEYTFDQTDIDNANWEPETELTDYSPRVGCVHFDDYDENAVGDGLYITQTVFNDDDKWEYLVPKYGPVDKTVGQYEMESIDSNLGVKFRRRVSERQECISTVVYNEDGEEVLSLEGNRLYISCRKVNGAYFFEEETPTNDGHYGTILYKYDRITTSLQEVARFEGKSARISVDGRTITVDAADNGIDEAELYNMAGSRVASARGGESLTINADGMPGGVYNVATKNRGRITGAQKIVLK